MMSDEELIPVVVLALLEEPVMHSPVVILHDPETNQVLPIWIGEPEARAIAIAYQGIETSRPLTHTLFAATLHELGVELNQVVIEKMESSTYYACLCLRTETGEEIDMDARPSDAIALALESDAPIFITKSILDRAGQPNPFPTASSAGISTMPLTSVKEDPESIPASKSKGMKAKSSLGSGKSSPRKKKVKESFTPEEAAQLTDLLQKARAREFEEGSSSAGAC